MMLYTYFLWVEEGDHHPQENLIHHPIAMRETVLHSIFLNLCKAYYALERD